MSPFNLNRGYMFTYALNLHIPEFSVLLRLRTTLMDSDFGDTLTTIQKPRQHLNGIETSQVGSRAASEVLN